jgi:hypothetical protein
MKRLVGLLTAIAFVLVFLIVLANNARATVWTMPALPSPGSQNNVINSNGAVNTGGATIIGSVAVSAIGTPSAPTFVVNGTAGSTSIVYACTGVDINGNATIPSATATVSTANATLSTTNSVSITCPGKKGAVAFLIHKVDTSHVLGICYTTGATGCTFTDDGTIATTFTYTPNTVDQTGAVYNGSISTGNPALQENTLGTQLTTGTAQAQTAFTVTGATTSNSCVCALGIAPPATWQTGIVLTCAMTANTLTPWLTNGTAGSITPAAEPINCRVL